MGNDSLLACRLEHRGHGRRVPQDFDRDGVWLLHSIVRQISLVAHVGIWPRQEPSTKLTRANEVQVHDVVARQVGQLGAIDKL